jgi:single-stranded-DNA-specific exonuclease
VLVRHGGHAAAAGFTVRNENLPEFIRRMKKIAEDRLCSLDLRPSLAADQVIRLSELNFDLLKHLAYFEPTGYGNSEAVFVSRDVKVKASRTVGMDGKHLKITFEDERGMTVDGIGFRMGEMQATLPRRVDVLYTFEPNEYNGRTSLQLNLRDLREVGAAD